MLSVAVIKIENSMQTNLSCNKHSDIRSLSKYFIVLILILHQVKTVTCVLNLANIVGQRNVILPRWPS